jgi:general secretion pathway protein D
MLVRIITALSAAILVSCAGLEGAADKRNWEPSLDPSLAAASPEWAHQAVLPFPVGSKVFVNTPVFDQDTGPCQGNYRLRDLSVSAIGLSYRDVAGSAELLRTMGYQVHDVASGYDLVFTCDQLPVIIQPGRPAEEHMTHDAGVRTKDSIVTGDLTVRALRPSNSVDMDHLLVFSHPAQPEDLVRLSDTVTHVIDVPSPQVYIETLVLEVSEEDSKELGISYENANIGGSSLLNLGADEIGSDDTLNFTRNTRTEDGVPVFVPGTGIEVRLRALVDEGRAEVLSRPSVLALSNRQAVIQIVDVIQTPILESTITQSGDTVVSAIQFEPLLLGITLNLRPRVSADRKWISLEIDATVEAEVDENSGTAFAPDAEGGRIALAEKKGSASRKVRTFARIPDRTPIIIGGLVAGNSEQQQTRVPGLGKIPFFGALFGATDNEVQKREVIIVLTPHVLAEDAIGVASNRPRDDVMSRVSDLMLFSNSYLVRAEDVFNMNFLIEDPRFTSYREKALELIEAGVISGPEHPAYRFADGQIPGESALVSKMLFDIVSRSANRVQPDKGQIFLPLLDTHSDLEMMSLASVVQAAGLGEDDGQALWLEFNGDHGDPYVRQSTVTRRTGQTWPELESGLRSGLGENRHGILIKDRVDLERLVRAIAVDMVFRLNGGHQALNIQNLRQGAVLQLAAPDDYSNYRVSARTAEIYHHALHYFDVLREELARTYRALDEVKS